MAFTRIKSFLYKERLGRVRLRKTPFLKLSRRERLGMLGLLGRLGSEPLKGCFS